MRWVKVSDYCIRTEDWRFTVCKIGDKFESWEGKNQFAVNLKTAEEAKRLCEIHAEARSSIATAST